MEREEPIMNLTGSATGKPGHSSNVTCVKFNRQDKNILISGGWDNTIQVWDLRTGDTVRSIYGPYIAGDALDIIDDLILSGQYRQENQLQIWDLQSGELKSTLDWNDDLQSDGSCQVFSAQFSK